MKLSLIVIRSFLISSHSSEAESDQQAMQVELYKYLRAAAYKMRTHFSQDLRAADASDDDTRCTFFVVCLVH